eukprot:3630993-Pleurochrysis_carterae.AAC.1
MQGRGACFEKSQLASARRRAISVHEKKAALGQGRKTLEKWSKQIARRDRSPVFLRHNGTGKARAAMPSVSQSTGSDSVVTQLGCGAKSPLFETRYLSKDGSSESGMLEERESCLEWARTESDACFVEALSGGGAHSRVCVNGRECACVRA